MTITNPVNNSTNLSTQIQLVFTPLSGATEYDYRIVTNPLLFNAAIPDSTYGLTYYQISNLLFGKTYYVEVRGRNGIDTSAWSSPVKFSTLGMVTLTSPEDKSIHQMPDVNLAWDLITGVEQYNYELDLSESFNDQNIVMVYN